MGSVALLLGGRCAGSPRRNRVQGFGSANGAPRIQLQTDHLTVHLFDRASLETWRTGWTEVECRAKKLWPDPATVNHTEARERNRISRTGKVAARGRTASPTAPRTGRRAAAG